MQERLRDSAIPESLEVEEELKSLVDEKMAKRREKLKVVQVVGVTCYSTTNPILKGSKFQICLLDECSQIPEPLSLLPLSQFGCFKLIAVGDPAQLPPTLLGGSDHGEIRESETAVDHIEYGKKVLIKVDENEKTKGCTSFHDLRRALFGRLVEMGYEPVFLRTQYRCHPRLITVPNNLFYGGRIKSGCREIDRPPLLSGLPTLLFWDTLGHGSEIKDSSKSYSNPYEAKIACQLINMMLEHGIHGSEIGVIVLYKSQASLVQELFSQSCSGRRVEKNVIKSTKALDDQHAKNSILKNQFGKLDPSAGEIQISTVDAFQGMEKNIIILSCCRTNGLGFLSSPNRLNVALTRGRHHLIIIGKASNLRSNPFWKKLLSNAASTSGSYISTPASSSELIISNLQEHISRKDPCPTANLSFLSSNEERIDDAQRPDLCIGNAQSNHDDNEKKSTIFDSIHSQGGPMPMSDACQIASLCEEAVTNNDSSLISGMKKKRMMRIEKNGTELDDKRSASRAKGFDNDLQMTNAEESQTAEPFNRMHASQNCRAPLEDRKEHYTKEPNSTKDADFEHGLVNQPNPSICANLPSESNKPICLPLSASTADFGPAYSEASSKIEPSEVKPANGWESTNGSADIMIRTIAVGPAEDGNAFNRLHEAKDDAESSDMETDDFAPSFDLGFRQTPKFDMTNENNILSDAKEL